MPLPTVPESYQVAAYDGMVRSLPGRWFHQLETKESPLYPILWALAGAIAYVRAAYEQARAAAIPMLSAGVWLSLHLKGIGLERGATESDESAKDRYQWEFKPTRNTRAGMLAALAHFTGLVPPKLRLETDRARGQLGQFRIVLDDKTQPWTEVNLNFVGELIRRYVSNGVIPSLDVQLQCLLFRSFPAWQFSDQFPMSWNSLGPIWERPVFINELRLPFARSLVAQVSAPEWRASRDRLSRFFTDALAEAPGAFFVYLSDEGNCPYLLTEYSLNLTSPDLEETFPPQDWVVDGWQFVDEFPIIGPSLASGFIAPFLSVPDGPIVNSTDPLPLQELHEIFADFPGSSQSLSGDVLRYRGLDFTRLMILEFLAPALANTTPEYVSPELEAMKAGPWQLSLTEGDTRWGNFPPSGNTLAGDVFQVLSPESIWWTDAQSDTRSFTPIWDGEAVYLAMEFILPKGTARNLRELELELDGDRIEYRRFGLPVDERINTGFVFKVKGVLA